MLKWFLNNVWYIVLLVVGMILFVIFRKDFGFKAWAEEEEKAIEAGRKARLHAIEYGEKAAIEKVESDYKEVINALNDKKKKKAELYRKDPALLAHLLDKQVRKRR